MSSPQPGMHGPAGHCPSQGVYTDVIRDVVSNQNLIDIEMTIGLRQSMRVKKEASW